MSRDVRPCSVSGCLKINHSRGLCVNHYQTFYVQNLKKHPKPVCSVCSKQIKRNTKYGKCGACSQSDRARETYLRHGEKIRTRVRKNARKNPEKKALADREYRLKNPQSIRANRVNRRAREMRAEGTHTAQERSEIFEFYGWRCIRCGCDLANIRREDRTLDHEIPLIKGGRNDTSNLVPMCRSCNSSKGAK